MNRAVHAGVVPAQPELDEPVGGLNKRYTFVPRRAYEAVRIEPSVRVFPEPLKIEFDGFGKPGALGVFGWQTHMIFKENHQIRLRFPDAVQGRCDAVKNAPFPAQNLRPFMNWQA